MTYFSYSIKTCVVLLILLSIISKAKVYRPSTGLQFLPKTGFSHYLAQSRYAVHTRTEKNNSHPGQSFSLS